MLLRASVLLVCAVAAAGCSANNYCLAEQEYSKAEIVPELQPVDGLAIPASPSALRLPDRPATSVPFGVKAEDGSGVCLDKPPRMALPEKGTIVEPKAPEPKT